MQIQTFGAPTDVLIRVEQQTGKDAKDGEVKQQEALKKVLAALGDGYTQRRVEVVGPAVSSELRTTGLIAVLASILAIIAYVWFRFEWQFAVGTVVALCHDVLLTAGIFSLFQLEFDLSIVAALLTILGYSVNDTVVVSDRIRENLRKFKRMPLNELLNLSINETLSRTILTGTTTIVVLIVLYMFGGAGDPQLLVRDAVRRADRHLFVDLHRRADPRLPRRQARLERDAPARRASRGVRRRSRGCEAEVRASAAPTAGS